MIVTLPTFHAERSPLKLLAWSNTARHAPKQRRKKEVNTCTCKKEAKKNLLKTWRGGKNVHVLPCMIIALLTFQAEMFALKLVFL